MEAGGSGSSVSPFEARRSSLAGKMRGEVELPIKIGWEGAQPPV